MKIKKITWLVSVLIEKTEMKLYQHCEKRDLIHVHFFYPLSDMDIYRNFSFKKSGNKNSKLISYKGINLPTNFNVNEESCNKNFRNNKKICLKEKE
ncbi:MAG: hypothetical protein HC905_23065 [Bacteroidales bacterium]|nr:hypothetical protein [Bacteroidales bacterium]